MKENMDDWTADDLREQFNEARDRAIAAPDERGSASRGGGRPIQKP